MTGRAASARAPAAWPWTATSAQRGGEGNDDATAAPAQPAAGTRGLQAAIGSVARPSLFLVAWRWRYELALAAGLAIAVIGLVRIPAAAWVAAGPRQNLSLPPTRRPGPLRSLPLPRCGPTARGPVGSACTLSPGTGRPNPRSTSTPHIRTCRVSRSGLLTGPAYVSAAAPMPRANWLRPRRISRSISRQLPCQG